MTAGCATSGLSGHTGREGGPVVGEGTVSHKQKAAHRQPTAGRRPCWRPCCRTKHPAAAAYHREPALSPASGGSVANTSRAAPATMPASSARTSAASSITPPRATLTMRAPRFICGPRRQQVQVRAGEAGEGQRHGWASSSQEWLRWSPWISRWTRGACLPSDQLRRSPHLGKQVVVEHVLGVGGQRGVQREEVALREKEGLRVTRR